MPRSIHRRDLLKAGALAGTSFALGSGPRARAAAVQSPNSRLNVAVIGPGGQGAANLRAVGREPGVQIVAICDVDDVRAGDAFTRFPKAKKFADFRRMYDAMGKDIDAVVISTPDHTHFHPAYHAMQMGKHVYLEKPMAHTVWETRRLTDLAAEKKVATQLGVQRHVLPAIHRAVELIQSGAIGTVQEVHSWIGSGAGRGMVPVPPDAPPVPPTLQWDLWLGPAAPRPYSPAYVPYKWRFYWDFGSAETGNWGCHILDIPYWALDLKYPTRVDNDDSLGTADPQETPLKMHATYAFPASDKRAALRLHWYMGAPPILKDRNLAGAKSRGMNNLFIGTDGMLLAGFDRTLLLPEDKFKDYKAPDPFLPKSPGFHREWLDACRGGRPATCQFGYSGPMTETVLLGNVAYRAGGGFDWDAATLKPSGNARAEQYVRRPDFRKGWEV